MTETAIKAKSALEGESLYQQRGRRALPILVRQARAAEQLTYSQVADELGMPNPRNMNYVLGSVGRAVEDYGDQHGLEMPRITSLVVNQDTGLPSEGIAEFLPDPAAYRNASAPAKRKIIDVLLADVFEFEQWEEMLREMGLPVPRTMLTPPVRSLGGGEGEEHRELKHYIAQHPESVGLSPRTARGRVEAALSSGDCTDVLFSIGGRDVGIEVKARGVPTAEVERGLYQVVKYAAVLV